MGRDPGTRGRSVGMPVELPGAIPYPPDYPEWNPGRGGRPISETVEEIAETFRAFAAIGIGHLQVWLNPTTVAGVEELGEILRLPISADEQ